jgi:VWFA-related protein
MPKPADDTVHLRVEEVLLSVGVLNDSGKIPGRLAPSDITIIEDNRQHVVTSVRRTPANILLIMDNSAEFPAFKHYELNRNAALRVIDSLAEDDRAAIISYGGEVEVISTWTGDKKALRLALDEKFKPRTKSHLYNALLYGAQEMLSKAPGRKSVILLTEGYDSYTRNTLDKAREALDRARATVYVLAQNSIILQRARPKAFSRDINTRTNVALDPAYRQMIVRMQHYTTMVESEGATLRSLAEDSGGIFWDPPTGERFQEAIGFLIGEIGSEYVISYLSERSRGDAGLHEVNIYPNRVGLQAQGPAKHLFRPSFDD